jgi:hypothetical protein
LRSETWSARSGQFLVYEKIGEYAEQYGHGDILQDDANPRQAVAGAAESTQFTVPQSEYLPQFPWS